MARSEILHMGCVCVESNQAAMPSFKTRFTRLLRLCLPFGRIRKTDGGGLLSVSTLLLDGSVFPYLRKCDRELIAHPPPV